MAKLLHWFGVGFLVSALIGIGVLLISDARNGLQFTEVHRHAGALSFILIGAAYIAVLLSRGRPLMTMRKEIALGMAFFLWGCEQFIPPGRWATAVDSAVIVIFVIDLSATIVHRLKSRKPPIAGEPGESRHVPESGARILGTELANGVANSECP